MSNELSSGKPFNQRNFLARLSELELKATELVTEIGHLKKILDPGPPKKRPAYDPEQGIGSPPPRVIMRRPR